jgi:3-oxoacyl-[acyl-carrier-protein] synthase-1
VVGADAFSKFIYSGFQSFMALSDNLCRPYDIKRNGINLGEGVSAILVSKDKEICDDKLALSEIAGGGQANDANHISGPSRDGTGLKISVRKAMEEAGIAPSQIGYINAHGTATVYNDEMEAIAFSALQLDKTPLNSLKGYFGHTLGTAGVLETILTIRQLNNGVLLKSLGYEENGVSKPLHVLQANQPVQDLEYALKTASGFGGGNAAIILKKGWN